MENKKILENRLFNKYLLEIIEKNHKNVERMNLLNSNFNHVYRMINNTFGTIACEKYLESILTMDRNKRQGFPFEIFLLLSDLKDANEKYLNKRERCVWDYNFGR